MVDTTVHMDTGMARGLLMRLLPLDPILMLTLMAGVILFIFNLGRFNFVIRILGWIPALLLWLLWQEVC